MKSKKKKKMDVGRKIRLVYPARRVLSHAAQAFLEVVGGMIGRLAYRRHDKTGTPDILKL